MVGSRDCHGDHQPNPAAAIPAPPSNHLTPCSHPPPPLASSPALVWGFPPLAAAQCFPADLDRELLTPPPPPPGRPIRAASEVDLVLETPPSQLVASGSHAPGFNARSAPSVAVGDGRNNSDARVGGWLACFNAQPGAGDGHSHSSAAVGEGLETGREAPWQTVMSRRPRRPALPAEATKTRSPVPAWLHNRCFKCLKPRHRAKNCRSPVTCRRCFRPGHWARECTNAPAPHLRPGLVPARPAVRPTPPRRSTAGPVPAAHPDAPIHPVAAPAAPGRPAAAPAPTLRLDARNDPVRARDAPIRSAAVPAPPGRPATAPAPPLRHNARDAPVRARSPPAKAMTWSGDHNARPAEVHTVIHATAAMQREAAVLASNAAVAWLDRDVRVSIDEVVTALCKATGALPADVDVVYHYPEAFLLRFIHQHHCTEAVNQGEVPVGSARLQVRAWRLEAHAENVDHVHHVRLCLEAVPLHAWDMHAVAAAIGPGCSLDYIEQCSQFKTETKVLALWAWTSCPSKIPRINWVTLPARNGGAAARGRRGLEHRVIIHLSIHEDPTGPSIVSTPYNYRLGVVDGESKPRDRRERITRPVQRHDRHDRDEDHDQGRRRDDRGRDSSRSNRGWGDRIRRSLSRAPRGDSRDHGRDQEDRDGRRRRALAAVLQGSRNAEHLPLLTAPLSAPLPGVEARGRSPQRQRSPRAGRRRSQESLTPPTSPPLSPTSVLPSSPRSKRGSVRASTTLDEATSPALIDMCSPTTMLSPLVSMSPLRPPGFEASPTPPLVCSSPFRRTPSLPRPTHEVHANEQLLHGLESLFLPGREALLPTPAASPPPAPAARRKTMAGVSIGSGLSIRRTSARLRSSERARKAPVQKTAEALVCRSIGIIQDGEDITESALNDFATRFKDQLPSEVVAAMRALFKLDDAHVNAVEDALISHGGADAIDHVDSTVQPSAV